MTKITILFPAHAGVIRAGRHLRRLCRAFPRTRGGDPDWNAASSPSGSFSPHTRG